MENVTFLGVETAPVSPTLSAQLQLPNGAGLIVSQVVPDSPASAVLKQHDILLKLDDQLLIEPGQFAVLIRNHADGDNVNLTYVRSGKQATGVVKLVKRDVPKIAFYPPWDAGEKVVRPFHGGHPVEIGRREQTDHVLELVGPGPRKETRRMKSKPAKEGFRGTKVNTSNSKMVYSDEQGSLELTIKDGQKALVAKNPEGDEIYSGPVTTPEERKALPPPLLERLERIEGMDEFSFETDDVFENRLRSFPPGKRQIMLPLHDPRHEPPRSQVL